MKQIKQSLEVVIVITLVVAALSVAASESVMWLTRRNLEVQFQAVVAKVTNVEELGQVFEQFAPRFRKVDSLFRFVNGPSVGINLGKAASSGGDYIEEDEQNIGLVEDCIRIGGRIKILIEYRDEALNNLDEYYLDLADDPDSADPEYVLELEAYIEGVEMVLDKLIAF